MTFKEFYYYSLKVEAEEEREWMRHSAMMSLHANLAGGKKRYSPDDFNPFAGKRSKGNQVQSKEDIAKLKEQIAARNKAANKQQQANKP